MNNSDTTNSPKKSWVDAGSETVQTAIGIVNEGFGQKLLSSSPSDASDIFSVTTQENGSQVTICEISMDKEFVSISTACSSFAMPHHEANLASKMARVIQVHYEGRQAFKISLG